MTSLAQFKILLNNSDLFLNKKNERNQTITELYFLINYNIKTLN